MLMGPAMLMGLSIVMLALLLPLPMVRPETAASRPRLPKVWPAMKLLALSSGARVSVPVVLNRVAPAELVMSMEPPLSAIWLEELVTFVPALAPKAALA